MTSTVIYAPGNISTRGGVLVAAVRLRAVASPSAAPATPAAAEGVPAAASSRSASPYRSRSAAARRLPSCDLARRRGKWRRVAVPASGRGDGDRRCPRDARRSRLRCPAAPARSRWVGARAGLAGRSASSLGIARARLAGLITLPDPTQLPLYPLPLYPSTLLPSNPGSPCTPSEGDAVFSDCSRSWPA